MDHANINVSLACIWVTVMKSKWGQHSLSLSFHTESAGQITRELTQAPPWAQQTTVSGAEPRPSTCKASQVIPGQGPEWETNIEIRCNSMFVRWGNSPESKSPGMFWKSWGLSEATQSGGSWISAFNMPHDSPIHSSHANTRASEFPVCSKRDPVLGSKTGVCPSATKSSLECLGGSVS